MALHSLYRRIGINQASVYLGGKLLNIKTSLLNILGHLKKVSIVIAGQNLDTPDSAFGHNFLMSFIVKPYLNRGSGHFCVPWRRPEQIFRRHESTFPAYQSRPGAFFWSRWRARKLLGVPKGLSADLLVFHLTCPKP